jgi:competence protein ComEC
MKNIPKNILMFILTIMITFLSAPSVKAFDIPSFSVKIGSNVYTLEYANNKNNETEIMNAVVNTQGEIYIQTSVGDWIDNSNGSSVDTSVVDKIEILNFNGQVATKYVKPSVEIPYNKEESSLDSQTLKVKYIDVGQGDSILIQQGLNSMLIDAGNNSDSELVKKNITDQGITKLDYVIGTHPHEDHIGGLDYVINNFQIGKIYMPKVTSTTKTFEDVVNAINSKGLKATVPTPGESFKLGEATCTILAPNGSEYKDTNNDSIVIKVSFGDNSFLFTGDAEDVSENEMLAKGYDLKSDVLKIGHHGSNSSTTQKFLDSVNPKYAIISVGKENEYGHPTKEIIDRLISEKISVYRTDEVGTIVATSDGKNITFNVEPIEHINNEQSKIDVKITSIDLENEVVTIENFGTDDINITGWKLVSTVGTQTYNLPNDFILKAGSTIYVTSGKNAKDDGKIYLKWTGSYIWNNNGDLGELYNLNNQLVSSM